MNNTLTKPDESAIIILLTQAEAKRLADLHLALAQEYRKLAGMKPVQTEHMQKHPERLATVKLDARGTVK